MWRSWKQLCFLSTLFVVFLHNGAWGIRGGQYHLQTKQLPANLNFMPTLGNGQLGYTVYGDSIFLNGVYNGRGGNSRRARLPNWLNVSVSEIWSHVDNFQQQSVNATVGPATPALKLEASQAAPLYEMNLKDGYFRSRHEYNASGGDGGLVLVEQRTYAHRRHDRALIYELLVQRTTATAPLTLKLTQNAGAPTDAFDLEPLPRNHTDDQLNIHVLRATTREVEHEHFQISPTRVYVAFSNDFAAGENFVQLSTGQETLHYRFVITADPDEEATRQEMRAVLGLQHEDTLATHSTEWQKFWRDFRVSVAGNVELSRVINAGIFYLASSLPAPNSYQASREYFGLSPTGLGRGSLDADYEGHNFWDTEIWMLPVVTQLSTAWTKALFRYRFNHLAGARYNSYRTGFEGARFPWESAYTGTEVINPCCQQIAEQQIHISPDIVFALSQFYATTRDEEWLCRIAWPLAHDIAQFVSSRVASHRTTAAYHIRDVMGPDEDHEHVDDNVYTNVISKLALEFASFVEETCGGNHSISKHWLHIAQHLYVNYDKELDYHPQHFGYVRGEQVKQADTVLLGYPLQFPINNTTRLNDLRTYEAVTRATGPAMTWSMFSINYRDIGEDDVAERYFEKSYQDYIHREFKVWSEIPVEKTSHEQYSTNFLTGIGGFLQAIINGYAGVRFYRNTEHKSVMEIKRPSALPGTTALTIRGIKFADATFTLRLLSPKSAEIHCTQLGRHPLELLQHGTTQRVFTGFTLTMSGDDSIAIQTL